MTELYKLILAVIVGISIGIIVSFLVITVRPIKLLVARVYNIIFNHNRISYKDTTNTKLLKLYSPVYELNKKHFIYTSEEIAGFLAGIKDWKKYKFYESISGVEKYFSNQRMLKQRTRNSRKPSDLKAVLTKSFGMTDLSSFGRLVEEKIINVKDNENFIIDSITLNYDSDAVIQYYYAQPKANSNGRVMVCLHGCSSAPDKILGIDSPDYTNNFALEAVKKGWTVLAPFILNDCNRIEVFDALGSLTTGLTLFGYELKKIEQVLKHCEVTSQGSEIDIYGISFGGKLAMYYSAFNNNINNMIISGAMVFDYFKANIDKLLVRDPSQSDKTKRLGNHLTSHRYVNITDILLNYFITSNECGKIIVEIGMYDIYENKSKNCFQTIEILQEMMNENNILQNRLFVNYFNGYHETNPSVSLNAIR